MKNTGINLNTNLVSRIVLLVVATFSIVFAVACEPASNSNEPGTASPSPAASSSPAVTTEVAPINTPSPVASPSPAASPKAKPKATK